MSNAMTLFGGAKLPSALSSGDMDATTKALAGSSSAGHRISIKGSAFRMIVDGKEVAVSDDRAMSIVVVAAAPTINRQYYEGTYKEGVVESPLCWSQDGKTPDAASAKPQSASCDSCSQNIAGSGQGESRACRFQQRLAVVLEGEIDGPVYQLALPATSLFGKGEANNTKLPLQAYARFLAQNGAPITAVVTEMRFDVQSATPKLTFKAVRPLSDDEYASSVAQGNSTEARDAVKLTVFQTDSKGKPAPAANPAPAKGGDGVETEPVAASKAKPAAPAAKRSAAEVVAAWDE